MVGMNKEGTPWLGGRLNGWMITNLIKEDRLHRPFTAGKQIVATTFGVRTLQARDLPLRLAS
ncbi:hypothetical protein PM082_022058 [Marasmius tenuissimus]|nr:hypothetical protein PM082_022058 [Marasmius tenuissimus]